MPFVVFHVDRILERADTRSRRGPRPRAAELRPLLDEVRASVLRDELVRRVAGRLELTEGRLTTLLASGGSAGGVLRAANGGGPETADGDRVPRPDLGPRPERMFLALCIAAARTRRAASWARSTIDELLTGQAMRRAARHLAAGHTDSPLADLPPDDEPFARLVSDLVALAGRMPDPSARSPGARPLGARARPPRAGHHPRPGPRRRGPVTADLAREREQVRAALHEVGTRLEAGE